MFVLKDNIIAMMENVLMKLHYVQLDQFVQTKLQSCVPITNV